MNFKCFRKTQRLPFCGFLFLVQFPITKKKRLNVSSNEMISILQIVTLSTIGLLAFGVWLLRHRRPQLRARNDHDDDDDTNNNSNYHNNKKRDGSSGFIDNTEEHKRRSGVPLRAILLAMQRQKQAMQPNASVENRSNVDEIV